MKHQFLLIALCLSLFSVNAQFDSSTYKVKLSDLETNSYPTDSLADGLVIYEKGTSYFDSDTRKLTTVIIKKIKVFNKLNDGLTTVKVPLYNNSKSKETIKDIKAVTHKLLNGRMTSTTMSRKDIFTEKESANITSTKFTLPNIQNGDVITYEYTIESPFVYNYRSWEFQDEFPKLYSEYVASIPQSYEYNIKLQGYLDLDTHENAFETNCYQVGAILQGKLSTGCNITTYTMRHIPAFREDSYMTSKYNYLSRIEFELSGYERGDGFKKVSQSWKDVDKEFKISDAFGKQLKVSVKKVLPEAISSAPTSLKKVKDIYNYIRQNYTWNGQYNIHSDVSIKRLLREKSGKVSELNLLLNNLLNAEDIDAKPVLLSTRKNGFATKLYPVITEFNYVIVEVQMEGKTYFLDATDSYLAFGELPFRCLNQYGRKLDFKNGSSWVDIDAELPSAIQQKFILSINPEEDLITGTVSNKYMGYHAMSAKRRYYKDLNNYKDALFNKYEALNISDIEVVCESPNAPHFSETFSIEMEGLNHVNNSIYLDPFLIKFFEENPFKLEERTYPVDFGYKDSYAASIQIELDDAYELETLPKNFNLRLPNQGGSLLFNAKVLNNTLTIFMKIHFKKSFYTPEEYRSLKAFMNKVVETQTKTIIVLKKKP